MSPRARRRPTNQPRPELSRDHPSKRRAAQPAASSPSSLAGTGIPEWDWRTTPVWFMFAFGGLIGLFVGAAVGASNSYYALLVFLAVFSMIFGLALGRVLRRWLAIRKVRRIRSS